MIATKGYAAQSATTPLAPFSFERRNPGPHDVEIDILFCGVCHTDIHFLNNDWGMSLYPMVPGHEIVGKVVSVGNQVKKFKTGDIAGVGCLIDSCRECENCKEGLEQYCQGGAVLTYSGFEKDGKIYFEADSDSTFVKGEIALLIRVLSGQQPENIVMSQLEFIDQIGLRQHIAVSRNNGLAAMIKQMKLYALAFQSKK